MCEIFEQAANNAHDLFSLIRSTKTECRLLDAYFQCMLPDEQQLHKLVELTGGDRAAAEERQEDVLHLGVAILAAFTYVPLGVTSRAQAQKHRISQFVASKLLDASNLTFTENWLVFLRHPTSCINVIKALYGLCMASPQMCLYLAKSEAHMNAIYDILSEQIVLPSMVVNEIVEIAIHTVSTIIIQLFELPVDGSYPIK